jgi:ABC-type transport system involved in cytochrome bd biosynthesis fused ATPase/permease subunit
MVRHVNILEGIDMSLFSSYFYTKVKTDDFNDIEKCNNHTIVPLIDLKTFDASYVALFEKSLMLIDNKYKYLTIIIGCSLFSFFSVYALFSENYILFLSTPIVTKLTYYLTQDYYEELIEKSREKWKTIVLNYFSSLPHKSRQKTIMKDFETQLERSSWVFGRTIQMIIPNIVEFVIECLTVIYAIYIYIVLDPKSKENSFMYNIYNSFILIGIIMIFPMLYYIYVIIKKQQKLTTLRQERREIYKQYSPLQMWGMYLFQNKKKTVQEIIDSEKPINNANIKFSKGWMNLSNEYSLFCTFIVMIIVYYLSLNSGWSIESSDWKLLLKNMRVFGQITKTISMFTHTTTSLETSMKDFDDLIEWIKKCDQQEFDVLQCPIKFPCEFSSNITLTRDSNEVFNLVTENRLSICRGDKILLKGISGAGKTQFVNSLQGLIPGTTFNANSPKEYGQAWEYLNQQTRETIPSRGLTLRVMLEGEKDDDLIRTLVKIVKLDTMFSTFDEQMEDLSGGEKMRLSILYTLWDMKKRRKQILILDEPEQGLDEDTRVEIIESVLENITEPVLVIYHGSKLDLLQMSFNKVWTFDKQVDKTVVRQQDFKLYKKSLAEDIFKLLN